MFGKPATSKVRPSVSVDWEDSDSSVDSIHSSPCSSTGDPDWPTSPGYEVLTTVKCNIYISSVNALYAETGKSAFTN